MCFPISYVNVTGLDNDTIIFYKLLMSSSINLQSVIAFLRTITPYATSSRPWRTPEAVSFSKSVKADSKSV